MDDYTPVGESQRTAFDEVAPLGMPYGSRVGSMSEQSGHEAGIAVLIAHSDPLISAGLAAVLRERRDFRVVATERERRASRQTSGHAPSADVVVADYDSALRLTDAEPGWAGKVLILTHSDSEAEICHALERGARGYFLLGCSVGELLDGIRSVHSGGVAVGTLVAGRIAEKMTCAALTAREETILGEMMLGMSNKAIARELALAVGTVKTHVKSILAKLNAASRTEAVSIAQRRGILRQEHQRV
jgi:two-component system NarL family response regulator